MKKYETFLPVFPGFYGTIFEPNESDEIDYINEVRQEAGLERVDDYSIEFDYPQYYENVAKECCDFLSDNLARLGFVSKITKECVVSPREYNFRNDSINIVVEMDLKNRKAIQTYIFAHRKEFQAYLKESYTSCSGFISRYSNLFEDWSDETGKFHDFKNPGHYLGAVLQFICEQEDIDDESMYYAAVETRVECVDYDFETTKMKCEKCGEWYSMRREYLAQVERDTILLGKEFEPIAFELWVAKNKDFKHCDYEI